MKNFLLLLFMLYLKASAQNYNPFPTSGGEWREDTYSFGPFTVNHNPFVYKQAYDSTENSVVYSVIQQFWDTSTTPATGTGGVALIREQNQIIYCKDPFNIAEFKLYDFNLNVDDTFNILLSNGNNSYLVFSIDSALTGTGYRKAINLQLISGGFGILPSNLRWIEGIGDFYNGLLYHLQPPIDIYLSFLCYYENGIHLLYGYPGYCWITSQEEVNQLQMNIYPVPATDVIRIEFPLESRYEVTLFNTTGQRLNHYICQGSSFMLQRHQLKDGIYFLKADDGKKNTFRKIVFKS